jgi:hypothetical protein
MVLFISPAETADKLERRRILQESIELDSATDIETFKAIAACCAAGQVTFGGEAYGRIRQLSRLAIRQRQLSRGEIMAARRFVEHYRRPHT